MYLLSALMKAILLFTVVFFGGSDDYEPILKQKILLHQMCLEAIGATSEKLSITPEITADTLDNYLVEHNLSDGRRFIICDKKEKRFGV